MFYTMAIMPGEIGEILLRVDRVTKQWDIVSVPVASTE